VQPKKKKKVPAGQLRGGRLPYHLPQREGEGTCANQIPERKWVGRCRGRQQGNHPDLTSWQGRSQVSSLIDKRGTGELTRPVGKKKMARASRETTSPPSPKRGKKLGKVRKGNTWESEKRRLAVREKEYLIFI